MKSLEKLKTALADIEINEEQQNALDEFLGELTETLDKKNQKKYQDRIQELETLVEESKGIVPEGFIKKTDAEAAYNMFAEDAEAAFNLAMADAEKAFDKVQDDIINESSQVMSKTIEDLYESLYEKAKVDVLNSPQFEALNSIKGILAPHILSENSEGALVKKVRDLEEKISSISEQKESLEREGIIESLVSELPGRESKIVRKYIEEAKSIDEIYERYNLALSLLEAKEEEVETEEVEEVETEETVETEVEEESTEEVTEESVISEENSNVRPFRKKNYESIDEAIIDKIWKQG